MRLPDATRLWLLANGVARKLEFTNQRYLNDIVPESVRTRFELISLNKTPIIYTLRSDLIGQHRFLR